MERAIVPAARDDVVRRGEPAAGYVPVVAHELRLRPVRVRVVAVAVPHVNRAHVV